MTLFENLDQQTPKEMTKTAFAARLGVSAGRVSQMVKAGLPVLDNGRIPLVAAEAWYRANIRQRAEGAEHSANVLGRVKQEREEAQRDLLQLDLARRRHQLIDRREVELTLHDRARAERDAHTAWVSRVAPIIAAELGADLAMLYAALDREMRTHLQDLAETPLSELLTDA
jgi:phage terminase Nu1 subunit (DNA packaging protein)